MTQAGYCTTDMIKERLLNDPQIQDADMVSAGNEAASMIDMSLYMMFVSVPLTGAAITTQIQYICADMAAGIYKRRLHPETFTAEEGGWLGQALEKLQTYVQSFYKRGRIIGS